ncbi:CDP-alcohol phosphatidyltransferase family protein [Actinomadura hibisca]|uniref:CDP-alcohol phosphatidyltransferase family protein n=1 Tax=Actinomadura hibisca TaxID=68565 RepID=UPI00082C4F54|nr:CDP-alcohol phosphatidyltransferase family protein [Actinomadura hibisca]
MTVAVIIATGVTGGEPDPVPTAASPWGDDPDAPTLLTRLCEQLGTLNVPDVQIVTRPELAPLLRKDGHDVLECADPAADLAEIALLARRAGGPVLLLPGDLVISTELLARLVRDARDPATAITVPADEDCLNAARSGTARLDTARLDVPRPVRVAGGRVASAGSSRHRVTSPNAAFPGVLHVSRARTAEFAEIADKLAMLLEVPGTLPAPVAGTGDGAAMSPDDDPAQLLLVGLVRSGVPVASCADPALVCRRAAGPDAAASAAAAHEAVAAVDEDRVRLAAAVKSEDGFFATYAVSSYSPFLVRWAAGRGLTPNAVTCISMGVAVLAAIWFAAGTRTGMVAGALLFYLSFVFDCVDGQLARYTRCRSTLGAWLDAVFDRAKEYVVFAGLAVGATAAPPDSPVHAGNVWPLAVAALALQTVRHMVDFSYAARANVAGPAAPPVTPLTLPGDGAAAPSHKAPAGGAAARLSAATSKIRVLHWAKKIIILPIGERFALIAVTAALGNARITFAALLAWGWIAAVYTLTGRVMRSTAR